MRALGVRSAGMLAAGMVLVLGVLVPVSGSVADAATCEVWNLSAGGPATGDLQLQIEEAASEDVLEIQGVCVGAFVIDKSLQIRNRSDSKPAVLEGVRLAPVVTANGLKDDRITVRLTSMAVRGGGGIVATFADLRITGSIIRDSRQSGVDTRFSDLRLSSSTIVDSHGYGIRTYRGATHLIDATVRDNSNDGIWASAPTSVAGDSRIVSNFGEGIRIEPARKLRVSGSSIISGNADVGIYNRGSTVLRDSAQVARNVSSSYGAGIYTRGRVVLRDRASIRDNVVTTGRPRRGYGGGIYCSRACQVSLFGHASIVGNISARDGGGIYSNHSASSIRMFEHARIEGNRAVRGAGVYLQPGNTLRMEGRSRIVGNTANVKGGGVFAMRDNGRRHARILVRSQAAVTRNQPDNIFRQRNVKEEQFAGRFRRIDAGGTSFCGLKRSGKVACRDMSGGWKPPASKEGPFTAVSYGGRGAAVCALRPSGKAVCWDGSKGTNRDKVGPFTRISSGHWGNCAIRTSGKVLCWRSSGGFAKPGPFKRISVGDSSVCAVKSSGRLVCWGDNDLSPEPRGRFRSVSVGSTHACALRDAGRVECWGSREVGKAKDRKGRFTRISVSTFHSCALTRSGAIECWGARDQGGIGWQFTPLKDKDGPFKSVTTSTSSSGYTCGLRPGGRVRCWSFGVTVPD